jgi:hypothetical protein
MQIIEWAFLCSSVSRNDENGLDVVNINTIFKRTDPIFLALKPLFPVRDKTDFSYKSKTLPPWGSHSLYDEWLFQLVVEDQKGVEIYTNQKKLLHAPSVTTMSIGHNSAMDAEYYTIKLLADGVLQQSLYLLLE